MIPRYTGCTTVVIEEAVATLKVPRLLGDEKDVSTQHTFREKQSNKKTTKPGERRDSTPLDEKLALSYYVMLVHLGQKL